MFSIQQDARQQEQTDIWLVAQDSSGDILGHVRAEINGSAIARESIATGVKQNGIGTLLALAYEDTLQREANRRGAPIQWVFDNQNLRDVHALQAQRETTTVLVQMQKAV